MFTSPRVRIGILSSWNEVLSLFGKSQEILRPAIEFIHWVDLVMHLYEPFLISYIRPLFEMSCNISITTRACPSYSALELTHFQSFSRGWRSPLQIFWQTIFIPFIDCSFRNTFNLSLWFVFSEGFVLSCQGLTLASVESLIDWLSSCIIS